jgi:hypothetical protein
MDNYQKYLKYKKKYLNLLQSIKQTAGAPSIIDLKNMNLFNTPDTFQYSQFLDPTLGFIVKEISLYNFYNFCVHPKIKKIVLKIYHQITEKIYITNKIRDNFDTFSCGLFIGFFFCFYHNLFNTTDFNTIKNNEALIDTYLSQLHPNINQNIIDIFNTLSICFNKNANKINPYSEKEFLIISLILLSVVWNL